MVTVLKGARLFDGKAGEVLEDAVLVVGKNGRILKVGSGESVQVPAGPDVVTYDLKGMCVLPGLIDAHVHIGSHGLPNTYEENLVDERLRAMRAVREMEETLAAGFTTVRNCGSVNQLDFIVKEAIQQGLAKGPRILTCGQIISVTCAGIEYFAGLYRVADGYSEFKKAAREQLKMGADLLKVMATGAIMNPGGVPGAEQPDLRELSAVVEEGRKLDKKMAAHAHGAQGIKNAVLAGATTIEHGSLADDQALASMVEHDVYLVTTLAAGYFMLKYGAEAGVPRFMIEKTKKTRQIRVNTVKKAIKAGVKVAAGSDAGISPYNYHGRNAYEIIGFVREGIMSPREAIISATKVAAEACGLDEELGILEEGKVADVIVVDGNPLENIELLARKDNIRMVFKDGKLVKNLNCM